MLVEAFPTLEVQSLAFSHNLPPCYLEQGGCEGFPQSPDLIDGLEKVRHKERGERLKEGRREGREEAEREGKRKQGRGREGSRKKWRQGKEGRRERREPCAHIQLGSVLCSPLLVEFGSCDVCASYVSVCDGCVLFSFPTLSPSVSLNLITCKSRCKLKQNDHYHTFKFMPIEWLFRGNLTHFTSEVVSFRASALRFHWNTAGRWCTFGENEDESLQSRMSLKLVVGATVFLCCRVKFHKLIALWGQRPKFSIVPTNWWCLIHICALLDVQLIKKHS